MNAKSNMQGGERRETRVLLSAAAPERSSSYGRNPVSPTVSDEHQGGLVFGFPIVNLHRVGPLVLNSELIHHHLDDAGGLVTLNFVRLEP